MMGYFAVAMLSFGLIALATRPFTVLFHELGHALPAILMTGKPVSIYIGSYGDPNKSLHFRVGLLDVWFTYNPLLWKLGLCVPSAKQIAINKQIIYTLTGPLASVVVAFLACYFTFAYDLHGAVKLVLAIFLCSSIFDLFVNLIPRNTPIKLYDGSLIYNDGFQLKQLFYYKSVPKAIDRAADLYNEAKFAEAAAGFKALLTDGFENEHIYKLAISSYLQTKNYKEAKDTVDQFIHYGKMDSDDFANAGIIYSRLNDPDTALALYEKSLELNPDNKFALNNKGFTLNVLSRFEEAIPFFDKAIEMDQSFAYSYNNRGLAKIKTGKTEEGLEDINHSFDLDPNNAYAFRNLGIYHLDKGQYSEALELFRRAKTLDSTTHAIDDLIDEAATREGS
jgi:tetratricopeptide (TPR) repeat protein